MRCLLFYRRNELRKAAVQYRAVQAAGRRQMFINHNRTQTSRAVDPLLGRARLYVYVPLTPALSPAERGRNATAAATSVANYRHRENSRLKPRPEFKAVQGGFTLLELLAIITLVAILATAALVAYDGVDDQAREDLTRHEMAELRKALLQFRRDSGSNAFPGQGPYDCTAIADDVIAGTAPDTWTPAIPVPTNGTKTDWVAWCEHPANFWMLFIDPLGEGWDPDTRRGWNGPYLQRSKRTYLSLDSGNRAGLDEVESVWAMADPFSRKHYPFDSTKQTGLFWQVTEAAPFLESFGSPYVLFGMDTYDVADRSSGDDDRIVNLGADGVYGGLNAAEPCHANTDSDDFVLCLLR